MEHEKMEYGKDAPAKTPGAENEPKETTLGVSKGKAGTGPLSELFGADSLTVTTVDLTKTQALAPGSPVPGV